MDLMAVAQLLGNLGEFVGAIAVVVTLIYLTIQIRQSADSMDRNTQQMKVMALNQHDELVGAWRMNLYFAAARAAGHAGQMEMTARNVANRIAFSAGTRSIWEGAGRRFSELVEPDFVEAVERALVELAAARQGAFRGERAPAED